ncbi:hypothetical protein BFP72_03270 [Reichenbachiella sp. 5M10]|uniref:hypothetical protein n=1 Tax=Reichenbachiella sp. 5M10 TaxID=1889772 RepID=UPI000C15D452|nr:hypothetical protein [Reichenbachiella sp. 5M10]PIB34502.1 hypothetical protein BFP72_03270 [Reichenbachiella sp. 5M10]
MAKIFTLKNILIGLAVIIIDLFIYFVLALLLMNYDDFYDASKGEYWSLESMTFWQKVNYISFNLWYVINAVLIGIVIYRVIKRIKKNALQQRV